MRTTMQPVCLHVNTLTCGGLCGKLWQGRTSYEPVMADARGHEALPERKKRLENCRSDGREAQRSAEPDLSVYVRGHFHLAIPP